MLGRGWCPGTCGELVQGITTSGQAFQVSLPVAAGTTVDLAIHPAATGGVAVTGLDPALLTIRRGVLAAAEFVGLRAARIEVRSRRSSLPIGVGMGSSTADVVAAARAVAHATGRDLEADELAELAGTIESSDPTMYDGMALAPRRGAAITVYSWSPAFTVIALIPTRGRVTHAVELAGQARHAATYDRILDDLARASLAEEGAAFAYAAVRSADLHQQVLSNVFFDALPGLAARTGAVGWNVAHTGTAAGLLYLDAERAGAAAIWVRARVASGVEVRLLRSLSSAAAHSASVATSTGA